MKKSIFSIKSKLLAAFVIISILTTTSLGISQYNKSKFILKNNLQNLTYSLLDKTEESILNYLFTFELLAKIYTENEHIKLSNFDENKKDDLLKQFETIVNSSINQQTIAIDDVAKSANNLNNIAYELNEEIKKFEI